MPITCNRLTAARTAINRAVIGNSGTVGSGLEAGTPGVGYDVAEPEEPGMVIVCVLLHPLVESYATAN